MIMSADDGDVERENRGETKEELVTGKYHWDSRDGGGCSHVIIVG